MVEIVYDYVFTVFGICSVYRMSCGYWYSCRNIYMEQNALNPVQCMCLCVYDFFFFFRNIWQTAYYSLVALSFSSLWSKWLLCCCCCCFSGKWFASNTYLNWDKLVSRRLYVCSFFFQICVFFRFMVVV